MRIAILLRGPEQWLLSEVAKGNAPDTNLYGTNHLASHGHDVTFLVPRYAPVEKLLTPLLRAVGLSPTAVGNSLTKQAIALLKRGEFDFIITTGLEYGMLLLLAKALRLLRLPPVLVVDLQFHDEQSHLPWLRAAIPHAHAVTVVSRSSLTRLSAVGFDSPNVHFVPFGMDVNFFRPQGQKTSFDVLSVGATLRDYRSLAHALGDGLTAKVLGSNHLPLSTNLEPVWGDYGTLLDLYERSRTVVLPLERTQRSAGITVLLGAMSMGKAIIATRTDGIPDYLDDGREGLLVEPDDVAGLKESIRYLLEDPDERARMGRNARVKVLKEFTTEKEGERLSSLLQPPPET